MGPADHLRIESRLARCGVILYGQARGPFSMTSVVGGCVRFLNTSRIVPATGSAYYLLVVFRDFSLPWIGSTVCDKCSGNIISDFAQPKAEGARIGRGLGVLDS